MLRARAEWRDEAQEIVDGAMDDEARYRLQLRAEEKLITIRAEMETLNESLRVDVDDFDLPAVIVPTAELDVTVHGLPLLDSSWPFINQCQALIDSKAYSVAGGVR